MIAFGVWLDPQKLAVRNMTAIDVANAIRNQNSDGLPGAWASRLPRGCKPSIYPLTRWAGCTSPSSSVTSS